MTANVSISTVLMFEVEIFRKNVSLGHGTSLCHHLGGRQQEDQEFEVSLGHTALRLMILRLYYLIGPQ